MHITVAEIIESASFLVQVEGARAGGQAGNLKIVNNQT